MTHSFCHKSCLVILWWVWMCEWVCLAQGHIACAIILSVVICHFMMGVSVCASALGTMTHSLYHNLDIFHFMTGVNVWASALGTMTHSFYHNLGIFHFTMVVNVWASRKNSDASCVLAVYVFRPNKWQPVFQKEKVLENPVISATFLPQAAASNQSAAVTKDSGELGWQQKHRLYLLDIKQQLFTPEYLSDVTSTHRATSQTRVSTSGDDDRWEIGWSPYGLSLSA